MRKAGDDKAVEVAKAGPCGVLGGADDDGVKGGDPGRVTEEAEASSSWGLAAQISSSWWSCHSRSLNSGGHGGGPALSPACMQLEDKEEWSQPLPMSCPINPQLIRLRRRRVQLIGGIRPVGVWTKEEDEQ